MNKQILLFKYNAIAIGLLMLSAMAEKGRAQVIEPQVAEMMSKLDTLDERSRTILISKVDEQRSELLGVLLKYLDESTSRNSQAAAIYLIGRNRLEGGVGDLIRHVDFREEQRSRGSLPLWEEFPAMEALINIGTPSIKACLQLLATDNNDRRRSLAVRVIRYVESPKVAAFILSDAHATEHDPQRKMMLADAQLRMQLLISQTQ